MIFEIFINPELTNFEMINRNLVSFLKFKNYLEKYDIIIFTKYRSLDFDLKKFSKLKIYFVKIEDDVTTLRKLWSKNIEIYNNTNWVVHYDIKDEIIEFDFIKMIFKKFRNIFVKKNNSEIYQNLFCINTELLVKFITTMDDENLNSEFIIKNTTEYYFLKYLNVVQDKESGYVYI